jgi:sterol desaturase/sphingolipid hydroxylase (fatty acid hydroxylase superfamily)
MMNLSAIETELIQLGIFFLLGFVIEAIALADEGNTFKNLRFNVSYAVLRSIFDISLGSAFAVWIASLIDKLPIHPLLRIPGHNHVTVGIFFGFCGLLVWDFFYYWLHRLQHASKWLWAQHALHHSDEHMNVTTNTRHHWLESPLEALFVAVPTALIIGGVRTTLAAYLVERAAGFFIHLNSRISLGRVFTSPASHRLHHSKLPEHIDKNFAAFFPLWDVLFGTWVPPSSEMVPTGLSSGETVYSLPYALAMPFVIWAKMLKQSLRPTEPVHSQVRIG